MRAQWRMRGPKTMLTRWGWWSIWAVLLVAYGLSQAIRWHDALDWGFYGFVPLVWLGVGGLLWWLWRSARVEAALLPRSVGLWVGWGAALAYLGGEVLIGWLTHFGLSPFAHRWPMWLANLWRLMALISAQEVARALLLHLPRRGGAGVFVVVTIGLTLLNIPWATYRRAWSLEGWFLFVGQRLFPLLGEQFLYSYLAWVGGVGSAILARGVINAFLWLAPVLPNPGWLTEMFVGVVLPVLIVVGAEHILVLSGYRGSTWEEGAEQVGSGWWGLWRRWGARWERAVSPSHKRQLAWLLSALVLVSLLWFEAGYFGVQPFLVSGVSMEPTLHAGDLVLLKRVPPQEIQVGDIILYRKGTHFVLHRVVTIQNQYGQYVFVTRGDNNNMLDDPVMAAQVEGKLIGVFPKLGWFSIGLRRVLGWRDVR